MRTMNSLRWTCRWMVGVLVGLGLVLGGTVASAQLYAASEDLWTIDQATGEGTTVGPFGVSTITSLAYDEASEQLFAYRSGSTSAQRSLQVIDAKTGEATQVGPSGGPAISGMTYDPITDTLYAASFSTGKLYTLDKANGTPTEIGSAPNVVALAFDLSTRMLFGTDRSSDLYAIDPATGDGTLIGPTGFADVQGLTFDRTTNTLYGVEWVSDSLLTIDVATGEATAVGTVGSASSLRGLAFAPVLEPVAHCGIGAVDAACGSISDVLFVNGLTGGDHRIIDTIDATMPVSFQISEAPSRIGDGAPTRVCLYAWIGAPELDDIVAAPANLGTMCFGPLPTATRTPRRVFNSIGAAGKLGAHSSPQPIPLVPDGELLDFSTRPQGTRRPLTVTIQGFIEDDCSRGDVPYSVTNGIVLRVL